VTTFEESIAIKREFLHECGAKLLEGSQAMSQSIQKGGKILILGNGGSAADAQHMAAEMVGRLMIERPPLPAIALTTDSSNITAVGNDYGYDHIFVKQIQALARPVDVVIAISTSGNSKNVVLAVEAARKIGAKIIALTGGTGGKLKDLADIWLNASKGTNSSRIQETHIFAIHSLVDLLDRFYLPEIVGGARA
jgi:D-sedoheptulose 7-phosphate isomerase